MQAHNQNFSGQEKFRGTRAFDKHFVKNASKKTTQLHRYILNGKFIPKMDTNSSFYPKLIFWFSKNSCTPVGVSEYKSMSLNITKYSWKCLQNVLTVPGLWICLVTLHVQEAYKDDSGFKSVIVLMVRVYIQVLQRVLNISGYGSKCLNNADMPQICLNASQYALTWLNIADCP